MAKETKRYSVFAWATGQDDNIGDSILRRAYLDALRSCGALRVWTKGASPEFESGLGLKDGDSTVISFRAWYRGASIAAIRGRALLALNGGEVPVSKRGALRIASLIPLILLTRLGGGVVVWNGAGIPVHVSALIPVYRIAARLVTIATWRDAKSRMTMRSGQVVPDWAFGLRATQTLDIDQERDLLAVILRGDQPLPDASWISWVRHQARTLALNPVVVVQVQRDASNAALLANSLGGTVLIWKDGGTHAEQEQRVRGIYQRSRLALGDRLHGLIVAATEGAVPLGWVPSSTGKIGRHFDAAGMPWTGAFEGRESSEYPDLDFNAIRAWDTCRARAVATSKRQLAELADEIVRTYSKDQSS